MTAEGQGVRFDYDAELSRYHPRLLAAMDVRPDDDVLDIGCGAGLTTRSAARSAVSGSAVGVDVSAERLAVARRLSADEGLKNVRFEQADAQSYAFAAEGFTLGVSRFGTMFFSDPEAAFANIARALRPGGEAGAVGLAGQQASGVGRGDPSYSRRSGRDRGRHRWRGVLPR
jgi:ubiquinone/menaquinone biosynthesis C-methylase UbiE